MPEAKEVFAEIENRIKSHPEKSAGLNATYQFDLSVEAWTLKIANGAPELIQGPARSPNTTRIATTDDWLTLATGNLHRATTCTHTKNVSNDGRSLDRTTPALAH